MNGVISSQCQLVYSTNHETLTQTVLGFDTEVFDPRPVSRVVLINKAEHKCGITFNFML
jgi:hypothetical protein